MFLHVFCIEVNLIRGFYLFCQVDENFRYFIVNCHALDNLSTCRVLNIKIFFWEALQTRGHMRLVKRLMKDTVGN